MTRFRNLLAPDPHSTPAEEQRRASLGLADVVRRSNLRWWGSEDRVPYFLLIAVAPFSQYDLALLDVLDDAIVADGPTTSVYVTNLEGYASVEQLNADFPGIGQPRQTPLVAYRRRDLETKVAMGKQARDLIADVFGLSAEELAKRVFALAPSSTNPPIPRTAEPPVAVGPAGSVGQDA